MTTTVAERAIGPNERRARATLADRPAGILSDVGTRVEACFAGFFNGCLPCGSLYNGSLKIGKAECEWNWELTWVKLKELGLIDWTIEEKQNHPSIGGTSTYVHLIITAKGHAVRQDDDAYFRELMTAIGADKLERKMNDTDNFINAITHLSEALEVLGIDPERVTIALGKDDGYTLETLLQAHTSIIGREGASVARYDGMREFKVCEMRFKFPSGALYGITEVTIPIDREET